MPRSPRSVHKILIQPQSIPHRPPSKVSRFQKQKMCQVQELVYSSVGALGCQFVGARYGSNKNQGWGLKYKHGCQQFNVVSFNRNFLCFAVSQHWSTPHTFLFTQTTECHHPITLDHYHNIIATEATHLTKSFENATQPPPGNLLRDLAFVFFQAVVYPVYVYFGYIVIWLGPKTNKPTNCQWHWSRLWWVLTRWSLQLPWTKK